MSLVTSFLLLTEQWWSACKDTLAHGKCAVSRRFLHSSLSMKVDRLNLLQQTTVLRDQGLWLHEIDLSSPTEYISGERRETNGWVSAVECSATNVPVIPFSESRKNRARARQGTGYHDQGFRRLIGVCCCNLWEHHWNIPLVDLRSSTVDPCTYMSSLAPQVICTGNRLF